MKKTILLIAAFSFCLLATSCHNETDAAAGSTTDSPTMGPSATSPVAPSDNTGSGISNSGDSTSRNTSGSGGNMQGGGAAGNGSNMQSGSGSANGNNSAGKQTMNGGNAGKQMNSGNSGKTGGSDSVNNRTGLGQSK